MYKIVQLQDLACKSILTRFESIKIFTNLMSKRTNYFAILSKFISISFFLYILLEFLTQPDQLFMNQLIRAISLICLFYISFIRR